MTRRLYYSDAYATQFRSRIIEIDRIDGRTAVVLQESHFYPASGGQPADFGTIAEIPVVDVYVREIDQAVIHVLDTISDQIGADMYVSGVIDWPRRFDHMQQHTGQHILSQAFYRLFGFKTVGFHLGDESATIDLDNRQVTAAQITAAEQLANQIIWENRPISARFVSKADADEMELLKLPDVVGDLVRIVDITDFDLNACGGTHVASTGAVGQIKCLNMEKRRGNTRIEFRCGQRALQYFDRQYRIVRALMAELTTGPDDILSVVQKAKSEIRSLKRELKSRQQQLAIYEAEHLRQVAEQFPSFAFIAAVYDAGDWQTNELRSIVNQLITAPKTIALLALAGDKCHVVFGSSDDVDVHMGQLIRQLLPIIDSTSGGGSAQMAQGGAVPATVQELRTMLDAAKEVLIKG